MTSEEPGSPANINLQSAFLLKKENVMKWEFKDPDEKGVLFCTVIQHSGVEAPTWVWPPLCYSWVSGLGEPPSGPPWASVRSVTQGWSSFPPSQSSHKDEMMAHLKE